MSGLNHRLKLAFQSNNQFIFYKNRTDLVINLPPGWFLAFPGTEMLTETKNKQMQIVNYINYQTLNTDLYGFKQSNFDKSFLMTKGLGSLEIHKYNTSLFEDYLSNLVKNNCDYQVVTNLHSNASIHLKANFTKLKTQSINNQDGLFNFIIGYTTKYVPVPFTLKDFIPKGFQSISQSSASVNQRFIANFSRFFKQGLLRLGFLQKYCQQRTVLKTSKEITTNVIVPADLSETVISDTSDVEDEDDLFVDADDDIEEISILDQQTIENKWFNKHNTLPSVYAADNISYLFASLPPKSIYSKDTLCIYDLISIKLIVPESILWLWGQDYEECCEVTHDSNQRRHIKIPIKIQRIYQGIGIIPFPLDKVVLSNPYIKFPLYIIVESNICHSNLLFGQNTSFPVLAILKKDDRDNGMIKTQNTYQLQYTPHNNQFMYFKIVDRHFKDVTLNENSYFTLQMTTI